MINAFKQIRLTNVYVSGQDDRIAVSNSGNLAFVSELNAVSGSLSSDISGLANLSNDALLEVSGLLSSGIEATGSALDLRITNEVQALNSGLLAASGELRGYIDDSISGVIDLAPEALDTLNELAAALGDDENFASNLTNTLTNISGSLNSGIEATGALLQGQIDDINSTYVTLGTAQTISGDKTFTGDTVFEGGFEVGASGGGGAALFVSGSFVGINNENPTEALDVKGNVKIDGNLFAASGIDANNAIISNVATPVLDADAVNLAYVTGVSGYLDGFFGESLSNASGVLQSGIDTKVTSANQKQFEVLVPTGTEILSVSFPGDAFSSVPSVQLTLEGSVSYQTLVRNKTVSGFDAYFSDEVLEENTYLNVFASNQ